jgi:molybdopterin molybdotransferase
MSSEFFTLMSPDDALAAILPRLTPISESERLPTPEAIGRVTAGDMQSPQALPDFRRSTVDGYAVRASDTFGASDSLPAYLRVVGEVAMGIQTDLTITLGEAAIVHTGGMVPDDCDAVVMVENTQPSTQREIEVRKPVAPGENVIGIGEDVHSGEIILPARHRLREADIGGLLALGITQIEVIRRPRVAIFATGDEVVPPNASTQPGQVRDVNSYTVAAMTHKAGANTDLRGILPDDVEVIFQKVNESYQSGADLIVLSAGSSVSVRDVTAAVFDRLGEPGVLVHGIATRPGKPTIIGLAGNTPTLGLPGNPVSAFVQFQMIGIPILYALQGLDMPPDLSLRAALTTNIASVAGREDYLPVKLIRRDDELLAEPIFFRSNLIFSLVHADGLAKIPLNKTGLTAGEFVEVRLI